MTSKFCPLWLSAPGYIHLLNHEKACIKPEVEEILFKLAIKDHSDKACLLTYKIGPNVCTCPRAMYMYKIMKNVHKIRGQSYFLKHAII